MVLIFHPLADLWRERLARIERRLADGPFDAWRLRVERRVLTYLLRRHGDAFDVPPTAAELLSAHRSTDSKRLYLSDEARANAGLPRRLSAIVRDPGTYVPGAPPPGRAPQTPPHMDPLWQRYLELQEEERLECEVNRRLESFRRECQDRQTKLDFDMIVLLIVLIFAVFVLLLQ
ncbi:MAG: hypothetical protein KIS92_03350 [Planctomycetota bacterium]|nr:hypothetical protein [Planctomycetota bacterium]